MLKSARDVQGELHLVRHFLQLPAMAQHKLQRAYENEHQAHPKLQWFRKSAKAGIKQIRNFIAVEKYEADQKLQQCQKMKKSFKHIRHCSNGEKYESEHQADPKLQ